MKLNTIQCEACRAGAPAVSDESAAAYMEQIPEWSIVEESGVKRLKRVFEFKNFAEALAFTNQVGALAEEAGHHPDLLTQWGKVTVQWWTHKIGGLHLNDFVMAAKTDTLYP